MNSKKSVHIALWGSESWEISAHPTDPSMIADGEEKGHRLNEIYPKFPLLFKVIDAKMRLSVQVHPNEETCKVTGGEPKTEMWCALSDGPIYAGLREGTTAADVEAAVKSGKFEELLIVDNLKHEEPRYAMLGWWGLDWRQKGYDFDGMAILRSPLLGDLPHEEFFSPLLWRIMGKGTMLPLSDDAFKEKDYIIVSEHDRDFRLNLAGRTRADGKREVFVSGLDVFADVPEARTLLRGLLSARDFRSVSGLCLGTMKSQGGCL